MVWFCAKLRSSATSCSPPWLDANTFGTPASGGDSLPSGDDAQPAGPLGHQHAAVGQERERPGIIQAARDSLDRERAGRGFICLRIRHGARKSGQQGRAHHRFCFHVNPFEMISAGRPTTMHRNSRFQFAAANQLIVTALLTFYPGAAGVIVSTGRKRD